LQELIIALGLFLVLEGLIYALFPSGVKKMAEQLPMIADQSLRMFGVLIIGLGVLIVWFVKG
jgi:uncharacterized protein YjeT (DUF2065 family)